jgi:hypothetical protein
VLLTRHRLIAAGLLIASAALFATGAAIERHSSSEPHAPGPATSQTATSADTDASTTGPETAPTAVSGGETDGDQGADEHPAPETVANAAPGDADRGNERGTTEHSEKLLGINPEATPLTAAAVIVSVLLAVALLIIGSPILAAGTAPAMAAFTALDIREVIHQLDESRTGLAALATVVAVLHLLTAAAAVTIARGAHGAADTGNVAASATRSRLT